MRAYLQNKNVLPVFTGEVGDSWLYGAAANPEKIGAFREVLRMQQEW